MKRNLMLMLLTMIMVVCLAACGSEKPNDTEEETKETSVEEQEDASANEELKNYLNNYYNNATPCSLGNYVDADVVSIRLDEAYFTDKIIPDNTEKSHSLFDDVDGEKYLVIAGEIKNNTDQEIKFDPSVAEIRPSKSFVSVLNYNDQMLFCQTTYTVYGGSDISDTLNAYETGRLIMFYSFKDEETTDTTASLLLGFSDLQEDIYAGGFQPSLDMEKCTHLLKYELNDIKSR